MQVGNYMHTVFFAETNGLWGAWGPSSNCSRLCYGRQTRTRLCNNPPPLGFNRKCQGSEFEYTMCNDDATDSACQSKMGGE